MKLEEKGQLIIMLVLVMTIGLAIGLSIIQKSLTDVSTATKVEQSSRAYSAAEAGIEKALTGESGDANNLIFTGGNDSKASITDTGLQPSPQSGSNPQSPIEYQSLSKEDLAQVWLASYFLSENPPPLYYKGIVSTPLTLDIFWGTPNTTDLAALELSIVYYDNSVSPAVYKNDKVYLDNPNALVGGVARTTSNKFISTGVTCNNTSTPQPSGSFATYQCKANITLPSTANKIPILIRARLLYNTNSQPLAVQAVGTCGRDCSLPPQSRSLVSTGTSGDTQRKVRFFQMNKVVPQYFDFAIFSAGDISK